MTTCSASALAGLERSGHGSTIVSHACARNPAPPPMTKRLAALSVLLVVFLGVFAAGVYAFDHSKRDTIAKGVKINGVPVGGLTAPRLAPRCARRCWRR